MFSDAYGIYMRENSSAHRRKFKNLALQAYSLFVAQFGDMPLDELHHIHITEFNVHGSKPKCPHERISYNGEIVAYKMARRAVYDLI